MLTIAATALVIVLFAIAGFLIVNEWSQLVNQIPA
jgi:hypothetical protein